MPMPIRRVSQCRQGGPIDAKMVQHERIDERNGWNGWLTACIRLFGKGQPASGSPPRQRDTHPGSCHGGFIHHRRQAGQN